MAAADTSYLCPIYDTILTFGLYGVKWQDARLMTNCKDISGKLYNLGNILEFSCIKEQRKPQNTSLPILGSQAVTKTDYLPNEVNNGYTVG
jgi:hypothetical protein